MSVSLTMPNRTGNGATEVINLSGHIVLVGANGSGKTRLGSWIENTNQNHYTVHRISAQKALGIPDYAQFKSLEQAEKDLFFGASRLRTNVSQKNQARWGGNPATFLLNDFNQLLSLLFAKSAERDRKHTEETRASGTYISVPDSPIDTILRIWAEIMPHRSIKFSEGKVLAKMNDSPEYHGREMSDGERIALYMMGQCLCAPNNSIVIVDEPEMHLHRSLVDKLWNSIEARSQTKTIIYITHDLDFASSRKDSQKLWIKSYSGGDFWSWTEVPDDDALPESLVLEVIGSRKNILFCEGERGSLDSTIYQNAYPHHHVVPRGSCTKVIESTKALRNNKSIHHLDAVGIIDRDYRSSEDIAALESQGIHAIEMAEIENIFCVEPVLRIVADPLGKDPDLVVRQVTEYIIDALSRELELQISSMAEKRIEYLLGAFSKTSNDKRGLIEGMEAVCNRIDVEVIYGECKNAFERAMASQSLDELLKVYNRKSLPDRISTLLGLTHGEYPRLLVRLLKGPKRECIISAVRPYMPSI